MLPYREVGGLPVVGGGVSLMTHSAGSVTTHRKAFKYVMASEPYRYQVMISLPYIKIYLFKNTYNIETKKSLHLREIFLDSQQLFRKVRKKLNFSPK